MDGSDSPSTDAARSNVAFIGSIAVGPTLRHAYCPEAGRQQGMIICVAQAQKDQVLAIHLQRHTEDHEETLMLVSPIISRKRNP